MTVPMKMEHENSRGKPLYYQGVDVIFEGANCGK